MMAAKTLIENVDCIENSDAVDGILRKDTIPEKFKKKPDGEKICERCKWHGY